MFLDAAKPEGTPVGSATGSLPYCPETEMLVLLQGFLAPILRRAGSWSAMSDQLAQKGYEIVIKDGYGILYSRESKRYICTSAHLGMPLSDLTQRLGMPSEAG